MSNTAYLCKLLGGGGTTPRAPPIPTALISVDLAHQVIFHAKVGKGGIIIFVEYGSEVENIYISCENIKYALYYIHISCFSLLCLHSMDKLGPRW